MTHIESEAYRFNEIKREKHKKFSLQWEKCPMGSITFIGSSDENFFPCSFIVDYRFSFHRIKYEDVVRVLLFESITRLKKFIAS